MRTATGERLGSERLGKASVERDQVRLVVLVAVAVDHHDDLPEIRDDVERVPADELRVLERDPRRQQRLRDAAVDVHRVEAEVPGEVREERQRVVAELRLEEEPRREQRLDPLRRQSAS